MTFIDIENRATEDYSMTDSLYSMFQSAVMARRKKTDQWRKNYMLTMNRWGRSADDPRDSEVFPIMRSRVAWMTDQEISVTLNPATDPFNPYAQMEELLCEHLETVIQANFIAQNWITQIVMAIWDAGMYGAGIMKAVWDSGLDGGMGNVDVQRVDPWTFYPDPNATSFADAQHFFVKHRWSADEIKRRFPDLSDAMIDDIQAHNSTQTEQDRRPQSEPWPKYSNDGIPVNLGQGPVAVGGPGMGTSITRFGNKGVDVLECWVKQNVEETRKPTDPFIKGDEPIVYDEWRVVFFSGPYVLLDETAKDLWDQDIHPYVRYVDDEMGEFWSTPIVSHLAPCQLALNSILAAVQANINLISNPIFMDVEGSGINRSPIVNKPGQRLTLKSTAATQQNKPAWLVPPNLPTMVMEQAQFWIQRMENISGLSGTAKGQQAQGRQAVATVQATQEAGFVSIRSSLRNLQGSLGQLFQIVTNLIMVNYDVTRTVAIVGDEGAQTSLKLAANHFFRPTEEGLAPLRFQLLVSAGSSKPTSRGARIAEIDNLKELGVFDNTTVLQIHQIPHAAQIQQRMQEEAQAAAMQQAHAAAVAKGPGTGHPH